MNDAPRRPFSDDELAEEIHRMNERWAADFGDTLHPCASRWADESHAGYTHGELTLAFRKVAKEDDWKGRIDAVVDEAFVDVCLAAVGYFTATAGEVVHRADGRARIVAAGYRMGPAGP